MKLTIGAVGALKKGPLADLADAYSARIARQGRGIGLAAGALHEVEAPKALDGTARSARESALLLARTESAQIIVALDERGSALDSAAFAAQLGVWRDGGVAETAFLIGGAEGHDPQVRRRADLLLSFGPMTWPHMLARVMLCEQLYRAVTILAGHRYHKA